MIPKSGYRFSEKIMLNNKLSEMPIQPKSFRFGSLDNAGSPRLQSQAAAVATPGSRSCQAIRSLA
jgi:hypothetical protein